ncbi:hypothetical protein GCM10017772_25440 [Promicromonospora soli]|uniref:Uncharacterized protein n=1 Tax=Promicromonospora soli TaxID=2035533 RepID=A0A919FX05_9MICO|nr:hypothetical protein GCM10017772_25440 [Promicromonospora soli]
MQGAAPMPSVQDAQGSDTDAPRNNAFSRYALIPFAARWTARKATPPRLAYRWCCALANTELRSGACVAAHDEWSGAEAVAG